jgi:hypothetical protein
LQQCIKGRAAVPRERVRWDGRIYCLPSDHLHPLRRRADTFEVRQMRVEIESLNASKQAQHVEGMIDLDRRRSPVDGYGRTQAKAVFDRHSEPG